mgnify:CR=1 FL=1
MAVSGMGLAGMFIARADKFKPAARGKALSSRRTGGMVQAQSTTLLPTRARHNRDFYLEARTCRAACNRASKRVITTAKSGAYINRIGSNIAGYRPMRKLFIAALMASAAWTGVSATAQAQDSPWMLRARVLGVLPDEAGTLKAGGATLPGDVDISDQYVPEFDITYFFNKHIAAELILAVTPHDVKAVNVTVPGALTDATVDLGDVWLLPPTLTLQYHFTEMGQFKPYVGAGVNATFFFDEDQGPVADGIDYDTSVGLALQAGVDYDLDGEPGGWAINADIKLPHWLLSSLSPLGRVLSR